MKYTLITPFLAAVLVSCNKTNSSNTTTVTDANTPVETQAPNTNYKPAFEGQTRVPRVQTTTPFTSTLITSDLNGPWAVTTLPDGKLLITENDGYLVIVDPLTGSISEPIKGLPEVDDQNQGGLLGLTLDPDFENNRMLYWVFSEKASGGNHTAVAKGRLALDNRSVEQAKVIYRALPTYDGTLHYGGRIIFDKEGHLFVSTGERSDKETRPQAQDLKSALGKILRITTDGVAVPNNPFYNQGDALPEIYSYGHRNPQGLAFHPETGDLWSNEFGPRGGDELNLIKAGINYGWPTITYGIEYSGDEIGTPPIQQKEGMEQPVYYWDPVLSPSGMAFYTGERVPEWKNSLFICGLSSTHISRLVLEKQKVVGEERLMTDLNERFRDITQGKDEALYVVTQAGKLYKLDKK